MRPVQPRAIALSLVLVVALPLTALAAGGSLTVDSVGGQSVENGKVKKPLSGQVQVTGRAAIDGGGGGDGGTTVASLTADAGDSPFVDAGTPATLIGAAFGGEEPYSWAWTASAGTLTGADAATAELDTTGLAAGYYDAQLTVTDAGGRQATDSVRIAVGTLATQTLLEATKHTTAPALLSAGPEGTIEFTFDVPAGVRSMTATIEWTLPTNDFDLDVVGPDGTFSGEGDFVPDDIETAGVANPSAGSWKVVAKKYAVSDDDITARVVAQMAADPRPSVDSGGPYTFLIGAAQQLDGTVSGGTAPLQLGWDTDLDGRIDALGEDVTLNLPAGRHLVSLRATDANGLERREMTSVLVADADRLALETTPITVIAINDTGINPYHAEFSAATYPDPDVLALTDNFTRHPSEYIPGYPANAPALNVTLGAGYFPTQDTPIWAAGQTIDTGRLYWIPGTKIIGAVDPGGSTGGNAGTDNHPILDDNGHGSGSASVAAGNRYGYCPTCLLLVSEGLDEQTAAKYAWVDIQSNSWGYQYGLPGWALNGTDFTSRSATERGQTVLFAAGNGIGNAFDVTQVTYASDRTGGDWNIVVGAIRRDNDRAIVGDGTTVHISAWGDGNLPSACRTGTVGQCAFGGTSAATPYTAGVFGRVLTEVRRVVGDGAAGQKANQVVANGLPVAESIYLEDGLLTRAELREAVLKTAYPLNTANDPSIYPYPLTAPYIDGANVLFEGYGAATPNSAQRAIDVLLGRTQLPDRSFEDQFFALDRAVRDTLWGGYDRDADGVTDFEGLTGLSLDLNQIEAPQGALYALRAVADQLDATSRQTLGANALTYWLHRTVAAEGDGSRTGECGTAINESFMDQHDSDGDVEPCYEARITTTAAAYRPIGIWPSTAPLAQPLPAGSTVYVTIYVAQELPTVGLPSGVLMATDRVIGSGEGDPRPMIGSGTGPGSNVQGNALPDSGGCAELGELCWTRFDFSFDTTRHAFTGEQLTFQFSLAGGSRSFAFGFEGAHASKIAIFGADMPASGLEFGTTISEPADGGRVNGPVTAGGSYAFPDLGSDPDGAGDHPTTRRVEVSLDDDSFAAPIEAALDEASGTWSAPLGELAAGAHTLYARAALDRTYSEVAAVSFSVGPEFSIQWQLVRKNGAVSHAAWQTAAGLADWSFLFDSADYASGDSTLVVRLVADGLVLDQEAIKVKLAQ